MKRSLSALLTLALVLSLVPAVFAAEATAPTEPEVFNFVGKTAALISVAADDGTAPEGFKEKWEFEGTKYYINKDYSEFATSRYWRIVDISEDIVKLNPGTNFRLHKTYGIQANCANLAPFEIAVSLKSQYDGFFVPEMSAIAGASTGLDLYWYMQEKESSEEIESYKGCEIASVSEEANYASFIVSSNKAFYAQKDEEMVSVIAGGKKNFKFKNITYKFVQNPKIEITSDKTELNTTDNKTASITSTMVDGDNIDPTPVAGGFVKYYSDHPEYATVDADTGEITAVAPGTAEITAKSPDGEITNSNSISITVAPSVEPEEPNDVELITGAFTTETPVETAYNPSVRGVGYNASEGETTVAGITATLQESGEYKGTYKMSAPEKSGEAQFLYWAKGLSAYKKIVSYENEFYYTPAGGDNNVLIAVYDNADSASNKAEFYNANGQLIKLITDESADKKVPALPSMAGYNSASSWKQYNGDAVVTAGEELIPEGTMIFVAQYDRKEPIDVIVGVEAGLVNEKTSATVPYGEVVTCTPDTSKGELKWWKKEVNGVSEIVSIDETYKFRAWENCTVTAEYADAKPQYTGNKMKIIIDTFTAGNEKAVMAEFIGFGDNTVEKGIMHNGTKIAMTKPGNQFTVTGKANDTFKGYAIVKNGEGFNLIVDGEATILNAE